MSNPLFSSRPPAWPFASPSSNPWRGQAGRTRGSFAIYFPNQDTNSFSQAASAQTPALKPLAQNHLVAPRQAVVSSAAVLPPAQHLVASVGTTITPLPLHQLSVPATTLAAGSSVRTRVALAHQREVEVCSVVETLAVDLVLPQLLPTHPQAHSVRLQAVSVPQQATSPTTVPQVRPSKLSPRKMAHPRPQPNSTRPLPSSSHTSTTRWRS
jgi:hypothetical protein